MSEIGPWQGPSDNAIVNKINVAEILPFAQYFCEGVNYLSFQVLFQIVPEDLAFRQNAGLILTSENNKILNNTLRHILQIFTHFSITSCYTKRKRKEETR